MVGIGSQIMFSYFQVNTQAAGVPTYPVGTERSLQQLQPIFIYSVSRNYMKTDTPQVLVGYKGSRHKVPDKYRPKSHIFRSVYLFFDRITYKGALYGT